MTMVIKGYSPAQSMEASIVYSAEEKIANLIAMNEDSIKYERNNLKKLYEAENKKLYDAENFNDSSQVHGLLFCIHWFIYVYVYTWIYVYA